MARPTTWSKEVERDAWKYIDQYHKHGHAMPSVVGLCSVLNRSRSTLYLWAEEGKGEFSDILQAINEKQELVTFNGSLLGDLNPTIAKLLLGKHGYHDKQDTKTEGTMNISVVSEFDD